MLKTIYCHNISVYHLEEIKVKAKKGGIGSTQGDMEGKGAYGLQLFFPHGNNDRDSGRHRLALKSKPVKATGPLARPIQHNFYQKEMLL